MTSWSPLLDKKPVMDDIVRRALLRCSAEHGVDLLRDPTRLEAYLRDMAPGRHAEIHCIASAVREGALTDLQAAADGLPVGAVIARLADRLHERLAMDREAALWAAQSLAQALGLQVTDAAQQQASAPAKSPEQHGIPHTRARAMTEQRNPNPLSSDALSGFRAAATDTHSPTTSRSLPSSYTATPRSEFVGRWALEHGSGSAPLLSLIPCGAQDLQMGIYDSLGDRGPLWQGTFRRTDLNRFVSQDANAELSLALSPTGRLFLALGRSLAEYNRIST